MKQKSLIISGFQCLPAVDEGIVLWEHHKIPAKIRIIHFFFETFILKVFVKFQTFQIFEFRLFKDDPFIFMKAILSNSCKKF